MEDYVKRQIDLIGQMLRALAEKLRLIGGGGSDVPVQIVQDELDTNGFKIDVARILSEENPVTYMVESLKFSDEALETFTDILLRTDAPAAAKERILKAATSYLDSKGYFSFSLHSYLDS